MCVLFCNECVFLTTSFAKTTVHSITVKELAKCIASCFWRTLFSVVLLTNFMIMTIAWRGAKYVYFDLSRVIQYDAVLFRADWFIHCMLHVPNYKRLYFMFSKLEVFCCRYIKSNRVIFTTCHCVVLLTEFCSCSLMVITWIRWYASVLMFSLPYYVLWLHFLDLSQATWITVLCCSVDFVVKMFFNRYRVCWYLLVTLNWQLGKESLVWAPWL